MTPQLVLMCSQYVQTNLNMDNACTLLQRSIEFEAKYFEEQCLLYTLYNATTVLKSEDLHNLGAVALKKIVESDILMCGDEGGVYSACVRWAVGRGGCSDRKTRDVLGPILPLIRLPTMQPGDIAAAIGSSDIVTAEEKGLLYTYAFTREGKESLPFATVPRVYNYQKVSRFASDKSSKIDNCQHHSVFMKANTDIHLFGFSLAACQENKVLAPGTLTVVSSSGEEYTTSFLGSKGVLLPDVMIKPIRMTANAKYVLKFDFTEKPIQVMTYQNYYNGDLGSKILSYTYVSSNKVTFTISNTETSDINGSSVQSGQFSNIFFAVAN